MTKVCLQILGFLAESLEACEIPPEPADQNGRALYERLQIEDLAGQISRRVLDLKKNMQGARHELDVRCQMIHSLARFSNYHGQVLREMTAIVSESRMFRLNEAININTRRLCSLQEANERASASLEIM